MLWNDKILGIFYLKLRYITLKEMQLTVIIILQLKYYFNNRKRIRYF